MCVQLMAADLRWHFPLLLKAGSPPLDVPMQDHAGRQLLAIVTF